MVLIVPMESKELFQEIGTKLRALRREKTLTQQQLGDLFHLSYKYVGEIERAEKNPSIGVLNRVAQALEVDLLDFLDFGPPSPASKEDKAQQELVAKINRQLKGKKADQLGKILKVVKALAE